VVIGDRFVLCNMSKQSRRYECAGIFDLILHYDVQEPNILIPPADCLIEGGDVIVDKQTIYIGISERTNRQSVDFIRKNFGDRFHVVPVTLAPSTDRHLYLHLDCVFNPVGKRHALIHSPGIEKAPAELSSNYELIEISAEEQAALCTNVLSVSQETVISRDHHQCARVNAQLRELYSVIELPFDAVPLTGGSLRCASLPLQRKKPLTA
jgi:N-dimethylarginine dimethylaminohydrolase